MRVAEFCDNYGPGCNGLMFAVQQLEGCLLDAGHEVIVVAPKAKGPNPHKGRPGRTELRLPSMTVPRMPTKVSTTFGFRKALRELEHLQPDVIHVHGLGPIGILGVWAAKKYRIPLVLTWHTDFEAYAEHYKTVLPLLIPAVKFFAMQSGGAVWSLSDIEEAREDTFYGKGWSVSQLLGVCRSMIEAATVVTCPSGKTASRARDIYPHPNVKVIPNGVDPILASEPAIHSDGPLITYVGRIAPEKGIPLLVEACQRVHAQRPDVKLMVVGDYHPYPTIRHILEDARDDGYVLLPGEQPREELGGFYTSADLFAFPSLTDTQALVLHEAAHAGLPIVSVDPELDLVINEGVNGYFAPADPDGLARTLLCTLDKLEDSQWAATAHAESRRLAGQWTEGSQSRDYLDLYAQLARKDEGQLAGAV